MRYRAQTAWARSMGHLDATLVYVTEAEMSPGAARTLTSASDQAWIHTREEIIRSCEIQNRNSEIKPQRELHYARSDIAGDNTERAGRSDIRNASRRQIEVGVIENVERFRAKLKFGILSYAEMLVERKVCVGEARTAQVVAGGTRQPERTGECIDSRGRIGKQLNLAIGWVGVHVHPNVRTLPYEQGWTLRVETDRKRLTDCGESEARVPAEKTRHLPAADNLIQPA